MVSKVANRSATPLRTLDASLVSSDNDGLQELITVLGATLGVAILDRLHGVVARGSLSENKTLEGAGGRIYQQKAMDDNRT
jgi:hypothetical protein